MARENCDQLCWYGIEPLTRHTDPQGTYNRAAFDPYPFADRWAAPSWSWASYDGLIETEISKGLAEKLGEYFHSAVSDVKYYPGSPGSLHLCAPIKQCMHTSDPISRVSDGDPECHFGWYLVPILTTGSRGHECCTGHACRHFRLLNKQGEEVGQVEFDCVHDAEEALEEAPEAFTCVVLGHRNSYGRSEKTCILLVARRVNDGADNVRLKRVGWGTLEWDEELIWRRRKERVIFI